jgi:hypothetical protein
MRHRSFTAAGIVVMSALMILSARGANAQTVANGPYYATPSWDQKFPCTTLATCARFVVLANWNSDAVLDRETGLVWEKEPNVFPFERPQSWSGAVAGCVQKRTGGRNGWRLPTIEELTSLRDETDSLPPGHPFVNVRTITQNSFPFYWSATKYPDIGSLSVAFISGFPGGGGSAVTNNTNFYWCVRGPGGANFAF